MVDRPTAVREQSFKGLPGNLRNAPDKVLPSQRDASYAERNNLNVRMNPRRMTGLTDALSKKMGESRTRDGASLPRS
jgi:hypothetical protein